MNEGNFSPAEARVFAKVSRRFLWFIMLLFMVNFVDRGNVGFAALTMNKELGISTSSFALALSLAAIFYFLFEIPSNLILERVGARYWLARIAVTWGLASCACMFIMGTWSLVTLRVIVAIAEAGFAPGTVLYMTYWYPQYYRARAQSNYMIAQPIAIALGSTVSGLLLGMNGIFGLSGWRWLFLIEGLPSVILGVIAFWFLTDKPKDAAWLAPEEKATLVAALARDEKERAREGRPGWRAATREILSRNFLIVCFAYGCDIGNAAALGTWTPLLLHSINKPGTPYWQIGLLAAVPAIAALIAMPLWTRHADKTRERFWHCVLPMALGVIGWCIAAGVNNPPVQLAGLVIANIGTVSAWPVFFTLPSLMLPQNARAAGIAFLNVVGIAGTAVTPLIMGFMKDATGTYTASMLSMGGVFLIGAAAMFLVPRGAVGGEGPADAVPSPAQ
ncbi:MAG TPA: MFS transporter [Stellaceae bacterium]|nr:MFS transporter [Stellaceae bacterium]